MPSLTLIRHPQSPPDASARLEMILSASSNLYSYIIQLANSSQPEPSSWIEGPARAELLSRHVLPWLASLEWHLSSDFFPPLLTAPPAEESGQPGTTLSGAAASAAVTLELLGDLFPSLLGGGPGPEDTIAPGGNLEEVDSLLKGEAGEGTQGLEKRWPKSEGLRVAVMARPRVKAWREGGERHAEWMVCEGGRMDVLRKAAKRSEKDDEKTLAGK